MSHEDRIKHSEGFYNGKKESEIPCVRDMLKAAGFSNQKISLDALHLNPETTKLIEENQGEYLIGIKENQAGLLEELKSLVTLVPPDNVREDRPEKEHGRVDERIYKSINISNVSFDSRWKGAGFQTLVWVERSSYNCKTTVKSKEISYYVSLCIEPEKRRRKRK